MEHSKLPWGTDVTRTLLISGKQVIADTYATDTISTDRGMSQANAEFIVKACNAYKKLKSDNKAMREALRDIALAKGEN